MHSPKPLLCTLGAALLVGAGPALAGAYLGVDTGLDFGIYAQSVETGWRYTDGERRDTRVKTLGVGWQEAIAPRLTGGLHIGYLAVTQSGAPEFAGLELEGYFAGLSLNALLYRGGAVRFTGDLDYRYHEAEHDSADQHLEVQWQQAEAGLTGRLRAAPQVTIYGGGRVAWLDGEQLARGTLTQTRGFGEAESAGWVAGLELTTDGGYVSVDWRSGLSEGLGLAFRRTF